MEAWTIRQCILANTWDSRHITYSYSLRFTLFDLFNGCKIALIHIPTAKLLQQSISSVPFYDVEQETRCDIIFEDHGNVLNSVNLHAIKLVSQMITIQLLVAGFNRYLCYDSSPNGNFQ